MCQPVNDMKLIKYIIIFVTLFTTVHGIAQNQTDSALQNNTDTILLSGKSIKLKDTVVSDKSINVKTTPRHEPRKATIRSLILPGWGQAYNKRYWEIPIVYGALGITGAIYMYNNKWYKRTRDAYDIKVNRLQDTALIDPRLQPLSPGALEVYRNGFRRDRDYSALWFVIFWALNVVDATVFAHLKAFDISEDLSLQVNPVINQNGSKGISLAMGYKTNTLRPNRFIVP